MRLRIPLLVFAAALLVPAAALAQENAGRALAAAGDVTIVRGAEKIAARAGSEVRAGDTIEIGAQSSAQLRFTDESIVALRAGTTFRISEYAFQGRAPEEQNALFNLVKGGMRTVTGLIGRARQDRYSVTTPTATIGIRGTHYTLVHCDDECAGTPTRGDAGGTQLASATMLAQTDAGSPPVREAARKGTYGSVTDGKIGVTNKTGLTEFGADQYFFVASQDQRPERLIAPPEQLKEARAAPKPRPAAQAQQQAAAAASGSESTTTGGGTGESRISSSVSSSVVIPQALSTNVFQVTNDATSQGLATILQPTFSGTVFYRLAGPFSIPVSCTNPPCTILVAGDITLGVNFALQTAGVSVSVKGNDNSIVNIGTPFTSQGLPITVSNGQASFNGTFNLADNPLNTGAFRCNDCGPGNGPGFFNSISFSGSISGSQATLTVSATDSSGSGSVTGTLTQATPPNNDVAAIVTPTAGGGASARSASFWGVQLDDSRRLVDFGPTVGQIKASVGTASNNINGTAPSAGNLVWGHWFGPGAHITDFNYVVTSPTPGGSIQQWITGTATNTVPPSLGKLTYFPVGSFVNNGVSGVLNSGSLTADFINRSMSINLNATNIAFGNTFQMNGTAGFSATSGRFSAGFASVVCDPCATPGIGSPSGNFGGFFAGANAEGAGVAFTAGFAAGTGVSGVVGLKR